MARDWKAEYMKAVALEVDGSVAFLDRVLTQEGGEWWIKFRHRGRCAVRKREDLKVNAPTEEDKKELVMLKKRLAAVGSELLVTLAELNASVNSKETSPSSKVRVLQLQLVCRVLRFGSLNSKMKAKKIQLRKEIRGLLDRVALLLDAANPPSLADEDVDERSPFQEFLQQKLGPRLQMLLPELMSYLLRVYELEEEESKDEQDGKGARSSMLPMPVVKPSQPLPELSTSAVTGNKSILSVLRQERPAKRARSDAMGLFKEVELPHQLHKQIQLHSRKSRRVSKSHSSSANKRSSTNRSSSYKSSRDTLRGVPASNTSIKAISTTRAPTTKPSDGIDLLRRTAAKKFTAPRLHRIISKRTHFAGHQATVLSSPSTAIQVGRSAPGRTQSPPMPGSATHRTVTTSSVVMRTPDRPKRLGARTNRRVLVEASPPLRRLIGTGASAPRLLQPKSSQPGVNPSPFFG